MRISDWSSDVCSSDLAPAGGVEGAVQMAEARDRRIGKRCKIALVGNVAAHRKPADFLRKFGQRRFVPPGDHHPRPFGGKAAGNHLAHIVAARRYDARSEEHTSETTSLLRPPYASPC